VRSAGFAPATGPESTAAEATQRRRDPARDPGVDGEVRGSLVGRMPDRGGLHADRATGEGSRSPSQHRERNACMSIVIDHVGLRAGDVAASRRMYEAALAELGFRVLNEGEFENDAYVLFGRDASDDFALHGVRRFRSRPRRQQRRGGLPHDRARPVAPPTLATVREQAPVLTLARCSQQTSGRRTASGSAHARSPRRCSSCCQGSRGVSVAAGR
jgi:catechol 2,3-dioxygenase-like lactoylglutathione lyase family enzyme